MAVITLATLRDYWKYVSDWVNGTDVVSSPKVTVSAALPTGTNNIGDVDLASAIPAGANIIGLVGIDQTTPGTTNGVQITAAIPAGANNIGDVDVLTLPPLPAGTNNIGDVDVITLPALPAGTNNIGDVDVLTLPATNVDGTALASAARTATTSSSDITNSWGKGILVFFDVTAVATSDVKVKVEGKDPTSGKYYTILEGASVTTISTNVYKVNPALTAAVNSIANDILPKTIRLTVTHANANSTTYSVGYSLV